MHLLIHDIDRDGWGSAALLCAALGPEQIRLHPLRSKDALGALGRLSLDDVHRVWVLDIPAPEQWPADPPAGLPLPIRWVDHHMATWGTPHPDWVDARLPTTSRPTTTMTVLRHSGFLQGIAHALGYTRALCGPVPSDWGEVLDGLGRTDDLPLDDLPTLLAGGPGGEPPALALSRFAALAHEAGAEVRRRLAEAPQERRGDLLVVQLDDAGDLALKNYSLAARRNEPAETVVALVHRGRLLYVGRDSGRPGIDLLAHFHARGLNPNGHAYVAFAPVPTCRIDAEIDALASAVTGSKR